MNCAKKSMSLLPVLAILLGYLPSAAQSEAKAGKRNPTINSIIKNWPEKDRAAYSKLRKAASAFFDGRTGNEVDLSGTSRGALELEESDSLENGFKDKIRVSDKCGFAARSAADFTEADKKLNAAYSKIMSVKDPQWGTITKEGIQATQQKWILYRDAWVKFEATRCPGITETSLKTLLTNERIGQLRDFIDTFIL